MFQLKSIVVLALMLSFAGVAFESVGLDHSAYAQKKRKKAKAKPEPKAEVKEPAEDATEDDGEGDEEDDEEEGEAAAAEAPNATLQRGNRMEFDGRLIRGETAGSGAVFLFQRVPSQAVAPAGGRCLTRAPLLR